MLEQRIQQQFFDSADLLYQAAEPVARPMTAALQAVVNAFTGGGKLLVSGGPLAPLAAALFIDGFERQRPPLAALALAPGLSALRALGLPGDVLLLLDDGLPAATLQALVDTAHGQDMAVVAFAGAAPGWATALTETDALITIPHERGARVRELHLMLLHALADAVDLQLMGEQETT
jgi:D-sedoheptulose 7-phosphate isomerase